MYASPAIISLLRPVFDVWIHGRGCAAHHGIGTYYQSRENKGGRERVKAWGSIIDFSGS